MSLSGSSFLLGIMFILWAIIHTALASKTVKQWVLELYGPRMRRWYRIAFVIFAGLSILPIIAVYAITEDRVLYRVPAPWRWAMLMQQVVCLTALAISLQQAGLSNFLGLAQLSARRAEPVSDLQVRGFYRYVRHPLYLFSVLLMFLTLTMTLHLLVLYCLGTLYFVVGSFHEEALLVDTFGDAYRDYREQVPRFLPRPGHYYREDTTNQRGQKRNSPLCKRGVLSGRRDSNP